MFSNYKISLMTIQSMQFARKMQLQAHFFTLFRYLLDYLLMLFFMLFHLFVQALLLLLLFFHLLCRFSYPGLTACLICLALWVAFLPEG